MADSLHNALTNHVTDGSLHNLHLPGYNVASITAMGSITTGSMGDLCFVQSSGSYYAYTGSAWLPLSMGGGTTDTSGGWAADANTWSYSSADSPTFVISVNADMTGIVGVGMRIKLTQTTVKYFIVTAVGNYSGGATLITVYGGTDYTLADAAITLPNYSMHKAPLGFPMSRTKWMVRITNTSNVYQSSPAQNTWYNLGSVTISIPIGAWRVMYEVNAGVYQASGADMSVSVTLSTANNSESDAEMTAISEVRAGTWIAIDCRREKNIVLAAKTAYYLNTRTIKASIGTIYNQNDLTPAVVQAVCEYL